jgi:hypothetical protein
MKTLCLITCLLFTTSLSFAGTGHLTLNVEVESERGSKDTDKNSKTPDESRSHWLVVHVSNMSHTKLDGLTLKWALYADDLKRGTDAIVVQKEGEEKLGVDAGQFVEVTTPKVLFEWIPQHAERTGSGRRSRAKKVDETGHRYHGYAVQVLQDGVVIGEAYSHRSLQKAE